MGIDQITKIYHAEWFKCHEDAYAEYRQLGDFLADIFGADVHSVLDIGCGRGFVIERLQELGYIVNGVDGSRDATWPEAIQSRCQVADVTDGFVSHRRDLVICTEVAEHIPQVHANTLVAALCLHADKYIYFTAAPPGQGGYDHVNEQPFASYWEPKFVERCWVVDHFRTEAMREACQRLSKMTYFATSSVIFRKAANVLKEGVR